MSKNIDTAWNGGEVLAKVMSEELKARLAEEMGVAHVVRNEGWGSVSSRDCGNLVKFAIQNAERNLIRRPGGNGA